MGREEETRGVEEPEGLGGAGGGAGGPARFDLGVVWKVGAYALLLSAGGFFYAGWLDWAFLAGALAFCLFFLYMRTTLIRKHDLVKVSGRNWRPRREVEKEEAEAAAEDGE